MYKIQWMPFNCSIIVNRWFGNRSDAVRFAKLLRSAKRNVVLFDDHGKQITIP